MIEYEAKNRRIGEFIAQYSWNITGALYRMIGLKLDAPSYVEIAYPGTNDKRTSKEIIQDVLAKFQE